LHQIWCKLTNFGKKYGEKAAQMMQSHSGSSNMVTLSGALFVQRFVGLVFGRMNW